MYVVTARSQSKRGGLALGDHRFDLSPDLERGWIASAKYSRKHPNLPRVTYLWESPPTSPFSHLASEQSWISGPKVSGISYPDYEQINLIWLWRQMRTAPVLLGSYFTTTKVKIKDFLRRKHKPPARQLVAINPETTPRVSACDPRELCESQCLSMPEDDTVDTVGEESEPSEVVGGLSNRFCSSISVDPH